MNRTNKINRIHRKLDRLALRLMGYTSVVIFCLIMAFPSCRNSQKEPTEQEINDFDVPFETPKSRYDSVLHVHNQAMVAKAATDSPVTEKPERL